MKEKLNNLFLLEDKYYIPTSFDYFVDKNDVDFNKFFDDNFHEYDELIHSDDTTVETVIEKLQESINNGVIDIDNLYDKNIRTIFFPTQYNIFERYCSAFVIIVYAKKNFYLLEQFKNNNTFNVTLLNEEIIKNINYTDSQKLFKIPFTYTRSKQRNSILVGLDIIEKFIKNNKYNISEKDIEAITFIITDSHIPNKFERLNIDIKEFFTFDFNNLINKHYNYCYYNYYNDNIVTLFVDTDLLIKFKYFGIASYIPKFDTFNSNSSLDKKTNINDFKANIQRFLKNLFDRFNILDPTQSLGTIAYFILKIFHEKLIDEEKLYFDELCFGDNIYNRKIVKPFILWTYKCFMKNNKNKIKLLINKLIRTYYGNRVLEKNHPLLMFTTWYVDNVILKKIKLGKDVKKLYGITDNNIATIITNSIK